MLPVILQAATPGPRYRKTCCRATDLKASLQLLLDMQATNAATIKKQEAALATLDELQKAADELKIFSKRG
jgi:hypothetical protein